MKGEHAKPWEEARQAFEGFMALRNKIVRFIGLNHLGGLGELNLSEVKRRAKFSTL